MVDSEPVEGVSIRRATLVDLPAITAIYNEAVATTVATFDTEPRSEGGARMWWSHHDENHPVVVADRAGRVVGWASLSAWSDRKAYDGTAEVSLYIEGAARGARLGTRLLAELVEEARRAGLHVLLARISGGNEASLRLHRSQGFTPVGIMHEVGRKFGAWVDVHVMERRLP